MSGQNTRHQKLYGYLVMSIVFSVIMNAYVYVRMHMLCGIHTTIYSHINIGIHDNTDYYTDSA